MTPRTRVFAPAALRGRIDSRHGRSLIVHCFLTTAWMVVASLAPSTYLPSAKAGELSAESAPPPKSLEEGLQRVQDTLGKYDDNEQREWRMPMSFESRQRPEPNKAEVMIKFDGQTMVSLPMLENGAIAFDHIATWDREVYDVTPSGECKQTHAQRSHFVTRYMLSLLGDQWIAYGISLSNGVQYAMGRSAFQGIVKWHADGFELIGHASVGRFYSAEGKLILGTSYGSTRFAREADELSVTINIQSYHMAHAPDGNSLLSPDFAKPFGSPFVVECRSR